MNSGLILAADEEAELAGVMAHEIGHVAACHAARENTRSNILSLASIPLIFVGGPVGYVGYQAAGLALPIEKSQQEIAQILPARAQYVVTTSEFDDVKERLAVLENRRKLVDPKESKQPS